MTFLRTFLMFIFLLTNNNTYTFSQENLTKDSNQSIDLNVLKCVLMPSTMSCRFFRKSDVELCESIKGFDRGVETFDNYSSSLKEAKRRGLNCRVNDEEKPSIASTQIRNSGKRPLASVSDTSICYNATTTSGGKKVWNDRNDNFVGEAKYRGLDCGVKNSTKNIIVRDADIAGSIWRFYDEDGDVRLYFFKKDNTFTYKNLISITGNEGKVFGDYDEKWSVNNNEVFISHNDGFQKIYLSINDKQDVMTGFYKNKRGKVEKVIGKLEEAVIYKHNIFFNYDKPSPKIIAKNIAELKNIKIKNNDLPKKKISPNTSNKIKSYAKNIKNNELEKERAKRLEEERKRKALEQKLALFEKEKQKRIELEKKLAALQSEKKKQNNKAKQNEIGSGFYVSRFRHIVTNQHVVNKCNKITVGDSMSTQIPAELIASDKRNDLAIIQTVSMEMASTDTKSFVQKLAIQIVPVLSGGLMRSDDVVGGEEIFVAGYPLGNMVSDQMKLTDGIVSATKGLDNDVSQFEISSVVRKGNSGGPIYDSKGNIVGVVVERFNVNKSDNVNFAIKGSTVKQFLSAHNVSTKWSNRQDDMSTKDIYKIASKQTVMVVCHR